MAHPGQSLAPSPAPFFAACLAHQISAAMKAAVELDVFTAIAEGAVTSAALADKCRATERGIRILCDYLVTHGFLTKADGHYGLTLDSAVFLNQHSPAYVGSAVNFLLSDKLLERMEGLTAIIRTGELDDATLTTDHPMWVDFARAMAPFVAAGSQEIAEIVQPGEAARVLDIAAGHGLFGIAFAQRYPQARITALDWPNVLSVAWENARHAGVADRFSVIHGSALEVEYGSGYDVILLTNFLHHFDKPTCEQILLKVHAALKPGGQALTVEFVPNPDRVSPLLVADFPMVMLSTTPRGDAYTFAEFEAMFRDTGFSQTEQRQLTRSVQMLLISTK